MNYSSTAVLPVQGNTTLYFHYFKTLTCFGVTVPLRNGWLSIQSNWDKQHKLRQGYKDRCCWLPMSVVILDCHIIEERIKCESLRETWSL
ncbi:hypothetical protein XELAEV_18046784mg [Xenopus laevis]|uniref:Uncharacterized protein n=1 Tax=Xenopus laevis TaxID=8355 RepID=A0A974BU61_XENLA|nr:hypothetical protein XELAEV_18046784mg [Xenopus laevis]